MPERDVVSFNTLISTTLRINRDPSIGFSLYTRLLDEGLRPNSITFASLLSSSSVLSNVQLLEEMHCHSIKFGLNSNGFVGSAFVNGYERCRGLKDALCAFEEIAEIDSVSWNIMIDACARSGCKENAVKVFARMQRECSNRFDCFTLTSVLKTCVKREDLGLGTQLHSCALKAGLEYETPVGNSLITMYSRCDGDMKSAVLVFRRILEPNIISWTAVIGGLAQNGMAEEAASLYKEMVTQGEIENEFLFASILPVFSALVNLELGKMVHARIAKSTVSSDVEVSNALIDMYFKCGDSNDAMLVFDTMSNIDVVSWTVMVSGLGQHGKGREAVHAFGEMRRLGFKPDDVTFLAALSACSHCGLVEEGLDMFRSMANEYSVKPRREHFACVVDLLGRSGRLREAEMFVKEMRMELDSSVWETLLGACRIHGEVEIGERSAKKVMELEPERDGPYVQLSNIYADKNLWEEKGKVRCRLDSSGLRKETARSWF
ncbi:uncharacterized protein A4U43_C06F3840 [Asparagus officinalis]|uniref:Pentacotripeptide-repeat region of PRORP domain-containing protein n=1 Tax=Asparagus officinalis TaxID=4686 RepID=A0A5P1EMP1_ASPOF|nr:pentatricopeptide repeat-containing protein At4g33170-like [Asparagus officinalis]ONK66069.1 uncharacterized protein A4U43_C06F3840 [Asparagus officinalis]